MAYGAHAEEHGAQAAVRRATAAAALRCQGGPEGAAWRSLRSVMGGELPPPTPRERLESHLAKRAVGDAAATEAEARVTAKHDAAPPGPAPTHVSTDAERLGEAAEVLGVQIDAVLAEVVRAQSRSSAGGGRRRHATTRRGAWRRALRTSPHVSHFTDDARVAALLGRFR
mgnify:FL=1